MSHVVVSSRIEKEYAMAASQQEISSGIAEIVHEIVGISAEGVRPEKRFVEDLDVDSLSMVEIAMAVRDRFGVDVPDEEMYNLRMVSDLVAYIQEAGVSA